MNEIFKKFAFEFCQFCPCLKESANVLDSRVVIGCYSPNDVKNAFEPIPHLNLITFLSRWLVWACVLFLVLSPRRPVFIRLVQVFHNQQEIFLVTGECGRIVGKFVTHSVHSRSRFREIADEGRLFRNFLQNEVLKSNHHSRHLQQLIVEIRAVLFLVVRFTVAYSFHRNQFFGIPCVLH